MSKPIAKFRLGRKTQTGLFVSERTPAKSYAEKSPTVAFSMPLEGPMAYRGKVENFEARQVEHYLVGKAEPLAPYVVHYSRRKLRKVDELSLLKKEVGKLKGQVALLLAEAKKSQKLKNDPLAPAKARGMSYMKQELSNPLNLSLTEAQTYSGRADRLINEDRKKGNLYALVAEGNTRGFRYPKWQFDVPASRLRSILEILTRHGMSCWSIHNFLTRPNDLLSGRTPSQAIGDANFPLERLLQLAEGRVAQHQGAS